MSHVHMYTSACLDLCACLLTCNGITTLLLLPRSYPSSKTAASTIAAVCSHQRKVKLQQHPTAQKSITVTSPPISTHIDSELVSNPAGPCSATA
mmetsp:Transcript_6730/g.16749  ORF Transcript_6730/g.16749 Transcript_6730/m.16749 type:complete len:94 (-) Transcript_6730:101-382(-)